MPTTILDGVQLTLPRHLSAIDRAEMTEQLRQFPAGSLLYYGGEDSKVTWQGDVFDRLRCIRVVDDSAPAFGRGTYLVLSNTCDISPDNKRNRRIHIVIAPVTTIARFRNLLLEGGESSEKVDSVLNSIRRQENTSVFYLPSNGEFREESLAFLDALQSIPVEIFRSDSEKVRVTSMSNAGWYVLLVKLALHFCRAMEGESRPKQGESPAPLNPTAAITA